MYYMISKKNPALKYSLFAVLLWASAYLPIRIILSQNLLSLEKIYTLKYGVAGLILLFCIFIFKMQIPNILDMVIFFISGLLGFALYIYFFQKGSCYVSPFMMLVVNATCPIITVILGYFSFRDKINIKGKFGLFMTVLGIFLISFFSEDFQFNSGLIYMFGAACCFSFYSVLQKLIVKKYSSVEAMTYGFIAGSILTVAFNYSAVDLYRLGSINMILWSYIVYLAIFPGILAYYFWTKALEFSRYSVDVVNTIGILPVMGIFFSFFYFKEKISYFMVAGMVFVLLGMLIFIKRSNKNY